MGKRNVTRFHTTLCRWSLPRGAEQQLSASRQDHARERDTHAEEAERRAEASEGLAAARDRLAHVTAEAASLREVR